MTTLNCKPGDLAIVVSTAFGADWRGKIFRCVRIDTSMEPFVFWEVQNPPMLFGRESVIDDAVLRPLRDTGDDATDETLLWKSLPLPEGWPA